MNQRNRPVEVSVTIAREMSRVDFVRNVLTTCAKKAKVVNAPATKPRTDTLSTPEGMGLYSIFARIFL